MTLNSPKNMNHINKIYVVGDKFAKNLTSQNIISMSMLEKSIYCNDYAHYKFYLGQGVNLKKIFAFKKYIKINRLQNISILFDKSYIKASRRITHKKKSVNVFISDPLKIDDKIYVSRLLVDDRCVEMSDHFANKHMPGMILIEAARQMATAITEKFYIVNNKEPLLFIGKSFNAIFNCLISPLEVDIKCMINKIKESKNNKTFDITIFFIQNNNICTEINHIFSVFPKSLIDSYENTIIAHAQFFNKSPDMT